MQSPNSSPENTPPNQMQQASLHPPPASSAPQAETTESVQSCMKVAEDTRLTILSSIDPSKSIKEVSGKGPIPDLLTRQEGFQKRDLLNLPKDLLKTILDYLDIKDIITSASLASKAWYRSVAGVLTDNRELWLLKSESTMKRVFELCKPTQDISYTLNYHPELPNMEIFCCREDWILMINHVSSGHENPYFPIDILFSRCYFFNPFKGRFIRLPDLDGEVDSLAFSCAPTSSNCWVFGLKRNNDKRTVVISTLKMDEQVWNSATFQTLEDSFSLFCTILFARDVFYCLGNRGSMGIFDPSNQTWVTRHVTQERVIEKEFKSSGYLVEIGVDIYYLYAKSTAQPHFFRLKLDQEWSWEEKDGLDKGITIFGSHWGSESRSNLSDELINKLFLWDKNHKLAKTYCIDTSSYLPFSIPRFPNPCLQGVWINPPSLTLDFNNQDADMEVLEKEDMELHSQEQAGEAVEPNQEEKQVEGDPEHVDGTEFYRQSPEEFSNIDPASSALRDYKMAGGSKRSKRERLYDSELEDIGDQENLKLEGEDDDDELPSGIEDGEGDSMEDGNDEESESGDEGINDNKDV